MDFIWPRSFSRINMKDSTFNFLNSGKLSRSTGWTQSVLWKKEVTKDFKF